MFIYKQIIDDQKRICELKHLTSDIFTVPSCIKYLCIIQWVPKLKKNTSSPENLTILRIMKDNDFYSFYSILGSFSNLGVSWKYDKNNDKNKYFTSIWPSKGYCFWTELFYDWFKHYYQIILVEPIFSVGFYQHKIQEIIHNYSAIQLNKKNNINQNRLAAMIYYIYKNKNKDEIEKKNLYIRNIDNWNSLVQPDEILNEDYNLISYIIENNSFINHLWYEFFIYLGSLNINFTNNQVVYIKYFDHWEKGLITKTHFIQDNKMNLYSVKLELNNQEVIVDSDEKSLISLIEPLTFDNIKKKQVYRPIKIDSPKSVQQDITSNWSTERVCKVCFELEASIIFIPCGHLCLCEKCKEQYSINSIKCPLCNENRESYKVYF